MKPYPPAMRENKRYIAFKVVCERSASEEDVRKALGNAVMEHLGAKGSSDAGYQFIGYDVSTGEGAVKCNNSGVQPIKEALTLLREISFNKGCVHIIKTTGSVKKAKDRGD